jgi:3-phenylpropionate/cinnamic acid dioxygenase small subunit
VNALKELAHEVLHKEAVFLDDQRWDDWLALYTPDCEYWAPTWRTEDELTNDPRSQISHIYYASRAGLEDRIVRIRSGKSPASTPMRRTAHVLGPVMLDDGATDSTLAVRATWVTHVFDPRHREQFTFFGSSEYTLRREGEWKISRKKILVKNDYFPAVVDVYCF